MAKEKLEKRENPAKKLESKETKKELVDNLNDKKEWFLGKLKRKFSKKEEKEIIKERYPLNKDNVKKLIFSQSWSQVIFHLDEYKLDGITRNDIAEMLIDWNKWHLVLNNLKKFPELDQMAFVRKMIDKWEGCAIALQINLFDENQIDYNEVADLLIKHNQSFNLMHSKVNFGYFKDVDKQDILNKLIDVNDYYCVIYYLEEFKIDNYQELADRILEMWGWYYIVENIKKFKGINHDKLAQDLIDQGKSNVVANNIMSFNKLSDKVLDNLLDEGYTNEVLRYRHK